MTSYVTPKKNSAFIIYVGLPSVGTPGAFQSSPTIASGDFKVSKDGAAYANLTNLPAATSQGVQLSLTSTEMNADNVSIICHDAAGSEWLDVFVNIQTSARQVDDLAYPATSGRSMVVDASGLVDANAVKVGPTGSGTAQTAGDIFSKVTGLTFTVASQVDVNVVDWKGSAAAAMTGDAFARLGAPAGASVSADIAAVKTDTAAVKVQTDKLVFTVANQVDVNVIDWKGSAAPAMTGDAYARLGAPAGASVSADIAAIYARAGAPAGASMSADIAAILAATLNAAGVRAAVGLASANLDTQLAAIPSANSNADALLDRANAVETGWTPRKVLRILFAVLGGKLSGAGTATEVFRDGTDAKDRVTATVDASGNRTAITLDGT